MSVYKQLPPSNRRITARESTRVCNAIALFQCMATHPLTRMELIRAKITYYLHPFLGITATDDKPLEFLRLTSLGVIGALVKFEDLDGQHIVHYLLKSEVFPLFLRCMDYGDELTQTVSALVVMKILLQNQGLKAMDAFKNCIPAKMTQENFITFLRDDPQSAKMLQQLFINITSRHCT